ncbi:hypothetical protein D9M68_486170 [compost metagenome]
MGHRLHHFRLGLPGGFAVQGFDLQPMAVDREDIPGDQVGGGDVRILRARAAVQAMDERRAHAVDDLVGDLGRNDLGVQLVVEDLVGESVDQRLRKGLVRLFGDVRIPGDPGVHQHFLQFTLGIGDQYRQFRARQSQALALALDERAVLGNGFQRTVEHAAVFQVLGELAVFIQGSG